MHQSTNCTNIFRENGREDIMSRNIEIMQKKKCMKSTRKGASKVAFICQVKFPVGSLTHRGLFQASEFAGIATTPNRHGLGP